METLVIDGMNPEQLAQLQKYIDAQVDKKVAEKTKDAKKNSCIILLASSDFDKVLPALIIASGAASFGMEVTLFCTLWGVTILKDKNVYAGKKITEQMFTFMTPGLSGLPLSKMHMMGMGAAMMKMMLKDNNVESLEDLLQTCIDLGVNMMACKMTMGIMGIVDAEIRPGVTFGGVAAFIEKAAEGQFSLFI